VRVLAEIKVKKSKNKSYAYKKFCQLCKIHKVTPYQVSVGTNGKVSTTVLSQWKNGDYNLKLDKLTLIANYFNVPVTVFIE
jgi:transcriptional regulator with XRE-family HTH domain